MLGFGILMFIVTYIVCFIVYYIIFDDMLKKEKYTKIKELVILTKKFNLDKKKMNYRSCLMGVAGINAFVLALTMGVCLAIPVNNVIKLVIAFVMIMGLILACYYCYGKYLNKKWGK